MHALLEVYLAGYIQGRPRVGQHPFIFISSRSHHEKRYSYDPAGFYHEIFLAINLDKGIYTVLLQVLSSSYLLCIEGLPYPCGLG